MNIIRLDNIKSSLSTTYSLTLNVEKHKDLNKRFTIVVLDEDDVENINSLVKLKGISINVLIIPKKFKYSFNESKYYKEIMSQLDKNYEITYF